MDTQTFSLNASPYSHSPASSIAVVKHFGPKILRNFKHLAPSKKVKCLIGTLNFVHRGRRGGVGAAWVVASCHDGDVLVNPQRQWLLGRSSTSPESCVCECQMSPGEPTVNCVCFALVWPHRRGIGGQGVKAWRCIHGACALWTSVDL